MFKAEPVEFGLSTSTFLILSHCGVHCTAAKHVTGGLTYALKGQLAHKKNRRSFIHLPAQTHTFPSIKPAFSLPINLQLPHHVGHTHAHPGGWGQFNQLFVQFSGVSKKNVGISLCFFFSSFLNLCPSVICLQAKQDQKHTFFNQNTVNTVS